MNAMRETMARQPADLRGLLSDRRPVENAAERLRGRRVFLVGTGTSWHAANHGAWLLREAGVEAWAVQAMDAALQGPFPSREDALVLMTHRNTKRYSTQVLEQAQADGISTVVVSGRGAGGDIETVEQERCAAFTASHMGALMRLAQLARALGADLSQLEAVPDAVEAVLDTPGPILDPPQRLLEFTGGGPNQWTAAEGALKVRETARVAAEGLSVEQFHHGPSVALDDRDALVCLDGGGPGAERLAAVSDAAERCGTRVVRIRADALGEPLSIFPLTAAVQRVALECAEALGSDPCAFGYDVPGRREAWQPIGL
ncbi:MAG TPA: SIS domain-containing protein [Gaiellaceae bacterium]|nr:SIS domain-containing protein [Gaiellaceae bacterium]